MPENPNDTPSSGEIPHNYADAHLTMNALNMTAGHDSVLSGEMHENSVSCGNPDLQAFEKLCYWAGADMCA
ncbi:hypothetical protein MSG28_009219 [Choristoneura fumiferana]|uniref:Uncharacterized protein n=1 Tax=Choristoneura fumiferana TaxID=7141 RepID=A0ACC0KWH4_CHOFU|nr:hypothetical protein MSG28_009219 [Choristoneura fumiferana]